MEILIVMFDRRDFNVTQVYHQHHYLFLTDSTSSQDPIMQTTEHTSETLHPLSSWSPVWVFKDEAISDCQNKIFYMTSRLRAMTIAYFRDSLFDEDSQRIWWNIRFLQEIVSTSPQFYMMI